MHQHTPVQPVFPFAPTGSQNRFASLTGPESFKDEINLVSRIIGLSYTETLLKFVLKKTIY